ncbi:MAG: cytoplasmic protein [Candidatus Adiutrix sp.]|jgi:TorA maturation chaperone TorD|nr:cytoplasmic protein [Candidatus Adiutrix sp.]
MKIQHKHEFVETYTGPLAQGFDRETDLATLQVYLQKLSDDDLMEKLLPRLDEEEVAQFFDLIARCLRQRLDEEEYHELFLREFPDGPRQF